MTSYTPPEPRSAAEVLEAVQGLGGAYWMPSRYDDGLVLAEEYAEDDGTLGIGADGGEVTEHIDGSAYPAGVTVTLAPVSTNDLPYHLVGRATARTATARLTTGEQS